MKVDRRKFVVDLFEERGKKSNQEYNRMMNIPTTQS